MVAVIAVHEVKVAIHQVIHMITMGNRFMTAPRSMLVTGFVTAALVSIGAIGRICGRHRQAVLINMIAVDVVKMPVMKIVHMAVMLDRGVAAACAMGMRVILVNNVSAHFNAS
jgi:hypothetical protein